MNFELFLDNVALLGLDFAVEEVLCDILNEQVTVKTADMTEFEGQERLRVVLDDADNTIYEFNIVDETESYLELEEVTIDIKEL